MTTATASRGLMLNTETLLRAVLALMLALSCLSFIEPSPYEFFFFLLLPAALLNGIVFTRTTMSLFFILFVIVVSQIAALMPYLDAGPVGGTLTPLIYTVYSVYMYGSAVLFAIIFSKHTTARIEICLKAYSFSCIVAGVWGILSWLNVAGIGDNEGIPGRVAGPFKDPNVLGSYCIMGVLYLLQQVMTGPPRFRILRLIGALIALVGGVFFSFSRGSWGAMIMTLTLMTISMYVMGDGRIRRSIRRSLVGFVFLGIIAGSIAATNSTLVETVTIRAKVEQDYDGGETGRFGNQKRSIPMLLERPFGFGPFRFPLYFDIAPHNSYVGAFADTGWIGGVAFFFMAVTSCWFAVRLLFVRSPFLRVAQVTCPALLGFYLQAFQIDIDHWRFVYLMIGAVWGMEAARRHLLRGAITPPAKPSRAGSNREPLARPVAASPGS